MSKTAVVTTRVDADILASLDVLAARYERSRAWITARAIERYVREETEFSAFVQEGVDALDRGDYITHEQLVANIHARLEAKKTAA